ncbi:proline-rich protein 5-like [Glandiceps talaboti]
MWHSKHGAVTRTNGVETPELGRPRRKSAAVSTMPQHSDIGRRRSLLPSLESSVSHFLSSQKTIRIHGLADEEWQGLLYSITAVFEHRKIEPTDLYELHQKIRIVLKSEISTFLGEYYNTHLLKKGMHFLREEVHRKADGCGMIIALSDMWVDFFSTMLPQLQAILNPVQTTDLTIRQMTLVGFRDYIVLDTDIEDALSAPNVEIVPEITQMLLVLQHVHDTKPPSGNFLRLEELVANMVSPYIGMRGLYVGGKIFAERKISTVSKPNTLNFKGKKGVYQRATSHDPELNNNITEHSRDGTNRVMFSIADESEDSSGECASPNGYEDDILARIRNTRRLHVRRGSVPILPMKRNTSDDKVFSDVEETSSRSTSPSTTSPTRKDHVIPEYPGIGNFQRGSARRGSMPVVTSILKNSSNGERHLNSREAKSFRNKLRLRLSQRKSKNVHYT